MTTKTRPLPRTGGKVLVDQLLIHGADSGYCVPGESYLEVLDALSDKVDQLVVAGMRPGQQTWPRPMAS